jgi:hypothetical protein
MPNENQSVFFIEALNKCDSMLYQSVHRVLRIGSTLSVFVASSERSFSSFLRLKTYLRKTGKERLNGLRLLNVHRETYNLTVKIFLT